MLNPSCVVDGVLRDQQLGSDSWWEYVLFSAGHWRPAVGLTELVSHFSFTFLSFTLLPMLNNQRVPAHGIFA